MTLLLLQLKSFSLLFQGAITSHAYSHDEKYVFATAEDAGGILVWKATKQASSKPQEAVATIDVDDSPLNEVVFHKSQALIMALGGSGKAYVFSFTVNQSKKLKTAKIETQLLATIEGASALHAASFFEGGYLLSFLHHIHCTFFDQDYYFAESKALLCADSAEPFLCLVKINPEEANHKIQFVPPPPPNGNVLLRCFTCQMLTRSLSR